MGKFIVPVMIAVSAVFVAGPAAAASGAPHVQTRAEALAQDAGEYAKAIGVPLDEAMRRLRAQEESVAVTARIEQEFSGRLAGISIKHKPEYRIAVLLTGSSPVPDRVIKAGGLNVPILFRTGATATRDEIVAAMNKYQPEIRAALPNASGMGLDQRTGELVLMVRSVDADRLGEAEIKARIEAITGVPVRVRVLDRQDVNSSVEGGARVEGVNPADGRRYVCTTGFVVTDAQRTGVVTAAHCPDTLTYSDPESGGKSELSFAGQWGAGYQDVQVNVGTEPYKPIFYADADKKAARIVSGSRTRLTTRAGDSVCHRGESSGYSCSEVELTDYAPPGDLCGGPCTPVWVSVAGPNCRGGDSGGPVFSGGVAFGIMKGANYSGSGRCNFYYYMSTDYLPEGWSLLRGDLPPTAQQARAAAGGLRSPSPAG